MLKVHKCFQRSTPYEWEVLGDDCWSLDEDDDIPLFETYSSTKSQKRKWVYSKRIHLRRRKEGSSKASRRLKDLFGLFQFNHSFKRKSRNGGRHRQLQSILVEDSSHWKVQSDTSDDDEWRHVTDDDFPGIYTNTAAVQFEAHDDLACTFSMCSI